MGEGRGGGGFAVDEGWDGNRWAFAVCEGWDGEVFAVSTLPLHMA